MTAEFSLLKTGTFVAGADLSSYEDRMVKPHTTAKQVVIATAGDEVIAKLINAPASGAIAKLDHFVNGAILSVQAGAATTAGGKLMSDADGQAIDATATNFAVGFGMTVGAANSNLMLWVLAMDIQA